MMKRKLRLGALLSVSVLMLALLIGGLYGTFIDEETSTGNTFSAGSLNLLADIGGTTGMVGDDITEVEGADGFNDSITFGEVYAGASGSITWTLTNDGSVDGNLVLATVVSGHENGRNEPEAVVDGSDADPGELYALLGCELWIDQGLGAGFGQVMTVATLADLNAGLNRTDPMEAGQVITYEVRWLADDTSGEFDNRFQGDDAQIDINFTLTQV